MLRKKQPTNPVVIRRNRDWTEKSVTRAIKMGEKEKRTTPKRIIENIPIVKFNRIFTKQSNGQFKLTGYKCSLCEKIFGDESFIVSHPRICIEVLNNYK